MTDRATSQADNILPPRRGKVLVLTLDTSARSYDISAVAFGGTLKTGAKEYVYLTMQAETADCYYLFHSATASDLNEATAVAAAGTAAFADAHCARLPAGQDVHLRIQRNVDKFLQVKGSAAGKLRIWASSQPGG